MKLKTVANIAIIATTITQANITEAEDFTPSNVEETSHYHTMSTQQVEHEVEKHSNSGSLPFDLGLELIKRWTNK